MEWVKIFDSGIDARSKVHENKPQLLIIHGKRICLVLYKNHFFATDDACPHNSQSLSKGHVNFIAELVCPLHGYRFSLKDGKEASAQCRDLRTYLTRDEETGFYIGL